MYWVLGEKDPSPLHPSKVRRTLASFPEHVALTAANRSFGYMRYDLGLFSLSWNTCGAFMLFASSHSFCVVIIVPFLYYVKGWAEI